MADGIGEPLFKNPDSKVDVIFVDGFGRDLSHWAEASSTAGWPLELLEKTGHIARVFRFRYNAMLDDFYPEPNRTGTSIDDHSAKLLRDLEAIAQKRDRPIILAARDFGGLVCANALSQQDANSTVVKNTRGLAFFETPFEGKATARWAKAARDLLASPNSVELERPNNLKERSRKLVDVNEGFLDFLESRKETLWIQYYYKTYETSTPLQDDLVEVTNDDWKEIADQLAQWITESSMPPARREDAQARPGSVSVGDTHYHQGISRNQGVLTGGVVSTSEQGIHITGSNTTHNHK